MPRIFDTWKTRTEGSSKLASRLGRELGDTAKAISGMKMASTGDVSFSPTNHWGVQQVRTIQFKEDCHCWVAQNDFTNIGT